MSTKETILEKSTELFARNGYNGVSVRTIARATGITEGSIYNHFSSKEDIMNEILGQHAAELEKKMPTGKMLIEAYDNPDWKPAWVYRIKMLENAADEEVNLNVICILTSEQYRNKKAADIVLKYYLEVPVGITKELFEHLEISGTKLKGSPEVLANIYQYPMFTMTQEYAMKTSQGVDCIEVVAKMKSHVEFFWKVIMERNFEFL